MGNKSSLLLRPEEIAQVQEETGCKYEESRKLYFTKKPGSSTITFRSLFYLWSNCFMMWIFSCICVCFVSPVIFHLSDIIVY